MSMRKHAMCVFMLSLMQAGAFGVPAHAGGHVFLRERSSEGLRTYQRGPRGEHIDLNRPPGAAPGEAARRAKEDMMIDDETSGDKTLDQNRLEVESRHDHPHPLSECEKNPEQEQCVCANDPERCAEKRKQPLELICPTLETCEPKQREAQ
jgi:hypothetical protein